MKKKIFILTVFYLIVFMSNIVNAENRNDRIFVDQYDNHKIVIDKNTFKYDEDKNTVKCWVLYYYEPSYKNCSKKIELNLTSRRYKVLKFSSNSKYSLFEKDNMSYDIIPSSNMDDVAQSICEYVGKKYVFEHKNNDWQWAYSTDNKTYMIWPQVFKIGPDTYEAYIREYCSTYSNEYKYTYNFRDETVLRNGKIHGITPNTLDDHLYLKVKHYVKQQL